MLEPTAATPAHRKRPPNQRSLAASTCRLESVGRMKATRRGVELVVGVAKTQLDEHRPRGTVVGVVPGEQTSNAEHVERVGDDGSSGLDREALPPVNGPDVDAELEDASAEVVRAQAAAADVRSAGPKKDRPVLDPVGRLRLDLLEQAALHRGHGRGIAG